MATVIYTFSDSVYIGGERKDSASPEAIQMSAGDYGSYDTATQQFTLYPSAGAFGVILYVTQPAVTSLVTIGKASVTGSLPGGLPTAH